MSEPGSVINDFLEFLAQKGLRLDAGSESKGYDDPLLMSDGRSV